MSLRVKVYGSLLLAIGLLGGGYFFKQLFAGSGQTNSQSKKDSDKENEASPVEVASAKRDSISSFLSSTANLRALRLVDVAARSDGVIQSVLVEEGDFVKKGQVLCRLDDTDVKIRLQLARQKLAQAELQGETARHREAKAAAQIENSRRELERIENAYRENLVSEQDYTQAKYQHEELEHEAQISASETRAAAHRVKELDGEKQQAELELQRTRIRAPFSGRITERTVEVGRTIRNLDSLFKLGAFSPLQADVFLSEGDAHQVRRGLKAMVRLGVDEAVQVEGQVARVSPVVDQSSGTVKVTVELMNSSSDGFKPGAFVRVDIRTGTRSDAVLVPKRAVLEEDGKKYVFVAGTDTAKRTNVRVGFESDGWVEIREGVAPGEKVIVAGQGVLKDGSKIRIVEG